MPDKKEFFPNVYFLPSLIITLARVIVPVVDEVEELTGFCIGCTGVLCMLLLTGFIFGKELGFPMSVLKLSDVLVFSKLAPHSTQNFILSGLSLLQFGQRINNYSFLVK